MGSKATAKPGTNPKEIFIVQRIYIKPNEPSSQSGYYHFCCFFASRILIIVDYHEIGESTILFKLTSYCNLLSRDCSSEKIDESVF